jgi:hypothetical protein
MVEGGTETAEFDGGIFNLDLEKWKNIQYFK